MRRRSLTSDSTVRLGSHRQSHTLMLSLCPGCHAKVHRTIAVLVCDAAAAAGAAARAASARARTNDGRKPCCKGGVGFLRRYAEFQAHDVKGGWISLPGKVD